MDRMGKLCVRVYPLVRLGRDNFDFKATWTINEEMQTEERNHARFSIWYGACVHVSCPSYLLFANANCEVVCVCVGCIKMNSGCNVDMTR